jgi:hypothetical protein
MAKRPVRENYEIGAILTPEEMTRYCLRHRARNAFGILDEKEIKQAISYAADYWRLEKISIGEFGQVADPEYPNRSADAYPIVHYFNTIRGRPYCEVLDGLHRIGMARALRKRKLLAWVGQFATREPSNEAGGRHSRAPCFSPWPRGAA